MSIGDTMDECVELGWGFEHEASVALGCALIEDAWENSGCDCGELIHQSFRDDIKRDPAVVSLMRRVWADAE